MATTYGVGCKDIQMGDIAADGGIGATLTSVGKVYKESASIVDEDGNVTKHFAEGSRYPFLVIYDAAGTIVKFVLTDISPAVLSQFLGGTVATTTWKSPVSSFSTEKSIKIKTNFNLDISIARAFIHAKLTWNLTTKEIAKIEITAEVLEPTKANEAPMAIAPAA